MAEAPFLVVAPDEADAAAALFPRQLFPETRLQRSGRSEKAHVVGEPEEPEAAEVEPDDEPVALAADEPAAADVAEVPDEADADCPTHEVLEPALTVTLSE